MGIFDRLKALLERQSPASVRVIEKVFPARAPRIKVHPLNSVLFTDQSGRPIRVLNVSMSGLALMNDPALGFSGVGWVLGGRLQIGLESVPLELKCVWLNKEVVGCTFVSPEVRFTELLRKHFTAEISALKMVPMNPNYLKPVPEGKGHRYIGSDGNSLYYIEKQERLVVFELVFFGNVIRGTRGKELFYGSLQEEQIRSKVAHAGATLVSRKSAVDEVTRQVSILFLDSILKLPPAINAQLKESIESGQLKE